MQLLVPIYSSGSFFAGMYAKCGIHLLTHAECKGVPFYYLRLNISITSMFIAESKCVLDELAVIIVLYVVVGRLPVHSQHDYYVYKAF